MLNTDRLNCDAVDSQPRQIDWQEALGEDGDGWQSFEGLTCDGCGKVHSVPLGDHECRDIYSETTEEIDGEEVEVPNTCRHGVLSEGPMMSSWYPVKLDDPREAAKLLVHLPLCTVEFEDGTTGLALTGGGMDLSWEICEAFVLLGYYPPLHFCELPAMSGRAKSDKDKAIIAACEQSCKIAEDWAARKRERLARLREWTPAA